MMENMFVDQKARDICHGAKGNALTRLAGKRNADFYLLHISSETD